MEVRFVQRGTEIDGNLRNYMENKIAKMEKFFRKILNCQIVVSHHKGNYNVETTANANGVILRAEENAMEPRKAFDQSLKNLERRIKRYNSYLKDKGQSQSDIDFSNFSFSVDEADANSSAAANDINIEKVKKIPVLPMSPRLRRSCRWNLLATRSLCSRMPRRATSTSCISAKNVITDCLNRCINIYNLF